MKTNFMSLPYAICFDLYLEALKRHYPAASYNNGDDDIRRALERFGFDHQQGTVYFGEECDAGGLRPYSSQKR
jgi:virulence-associated protein VapD